ncbi:DUF5677 domain-containing protein [Nonomuraea rhizosphaerae]|uniref:DUF5677 domain-containing protein n=1 Tax=Nonomuraea rhizosphaerae TaxID=2665663 RepID=UPI001C5DD504|nr:DUF5677 domain-containing protein [Nonomuraea rhizosphaerae]
MISTSRGNEEAAQRVIPVAERLLGSYRLYEPRLSIGPVDVVGKHRPVFPAIAGWWMHVNALTADYLLLLRSGSTLTIVPLFRNIFEHVLAMMWLREAGTDGVTAIDGYTWDQQVKLYDGAKANGWPAAQNAESPARPAHVPEKDDQSPEAKRFRTLKGEFANLKNLVDAHENDRFAVSDHYEVYRLLSSYSHASAHTAAAYVRQAADGELTFNAPNSRSGAADILWLPVCLIQAGTTLSSTIEGSPLEAVIEQAITELGIPRDQLMIKRTPKGDTPQT